MRRSIAWQMILPIPIVIVIAVVLAWLLLPPMIAGHTVEGAIQAAQVTARQFKTLRAYYTEFVVAKVVGTGALKANFDHASNDRAIPLPATMIHDLSGLLKKEGASLSLYSPYPFPNRKDRNLDPFGRDAWNFLSANPGGVFSRRDTVDGKEMVRVAVADRMTDQSCVTCHNTRADSPKRDWKLGDVRGVLEVDTDIGGALALANQLITRVLVGIALAGAVLAGISLVIARRVGRPIRTMTAAMRKLASGELDVEVPQSARKDEIGDMAGAMQVFKDNTIEAARLRAEREESDVRGAAQRRADMYRLADDFQAAIGEVVETVSSASTELEAAARNLTQTADTTRSLSASVLAASGQTSTNVNSVAAATEELSQSVNEISSRMQEACRITAAAVEQVGETDARIARLSDAANRIGAVLTLIQTIASQTNLLALNATIEAARVGEAGRGFAVVAAEVKELATQTAKATEDIHAQIADMQTATEESVASIKDIRATIARISEISAGIAAAVEQQGVATGEIAGNIQQAAQGASEVSSNIETLSHGAADTGSASGQVLSSAARLSEDSHRLRSAVDRFLMSVRAA